MEISVVPMTNDVIMLQYYVLDVLKIIIKSNQIAKTTASQYNRPGQETAKILICIKEFP